MKRIQAVVGGAAVLWTGSLLPLRPTPVAVTGVALLQVACYVLYLATRLRLQRQSQEHALELMTAIGNGFQGSLVVRADGQIELRSQPDSTKYVPSRAVYLEHSER
jgi:membrane protein implicated in regulation of membrane protease activity